ncbi:HDOD domain-containing protein [Dyella tabacisoli]|uniref:HDOD domain-containing protein n=1 Tax=Dyella tabacisoli TaxID=2282381 RepID=A0A369UMG6_9GAMM|nr:HDOD domain-containing protein [Dyella tabacisoli]RDD81786.1 HDOD domain-containing protein [Dyella tabacisoli]
MMGLWQRLFARERVPDRHAWQPHEPILAARPVPAAPQGHTLANAQLEDRFYRFVFGLPASSQTTLDTQEQMALERLDALCGGDRYDVSGLPRMPSVLPQLLRALRNDHLSGAKLAELIGRDPVLVGEVMRVTGSVHYRTLQPIASLQHAVVLLGQEGLRHVVSLYVMKPILLASGGGFGQIAGQRLWDHAERCAHAAVFLGKGLCDPFETYLAGLVCHTGIGAVIRTLDIEFGGTFTAYTPPFVAGIARVAAELTLQAARYWELPVHVLDTLAERIEYTASAPSSLMGQILHAADHAAMMQLLTEHRLIDPYTSMSAEASHRFSAQQLARCQQDLQRNFSANL